MVIATKYPNIQDWNQHKEKGLNGGDDYQVPPNAEVSFFIYGVVESGIDPLIIKRDNGLKTRIRHLKSVNVKKGDKVYPETVLGIAQGKGGLSPHIEDVNRLGARIRHTPDSPKVKDNFMFRLVHISGLAYIVGITGKMEPIISSEDLGLLIRLYNSTTPNDPMLAKELVICGNYLKAVNGQNNDTVSIVKSIFKELAK
jgi:hypothetical protein